MASYLLIESRNIFGIGEVAFCTIRRGGSSAPAIGIPGFGAERRPAGASESLCAEIHRARAGRG